MKQSILYLLYLILFLLLNTPLASAQWNDDYFLLSEPDTQNSMANKGLGNKNQSLQKRTPTHFLTKPNSTDTPQSPIIEKVPFNQTINEIQTPLAKSPNTFIDLWFGEKYLNYQSNSWYLDYEGQSSIFGVRGELNFEPQMYGVFEYQTGFYYKIKNAEINNSSYSSLKDEFYSVGFKIVYPNNNSIQLSYGEKQISHSRQNSQKTGLRIQGIPIKGSTLYNYDSKLNFNFSFLVFPYFKITENPSVTQTESGKSALGLLTGLQIESIQQQSIDEFLIFSFAMQTSTIIFNKATYTDPFDHNQPEKIKIFSIENQFNIGYRWTH